MGLEDMDQAFLSRIGSYLPQWQAVGEDRGPEAALMYAAQRLLEDTRSRMGRLPEKHEMEFLRAWGLEPAPAAPMSVYAALTAPQGELVPAGSEWYLSGSGSRVWRTAHTVHAESLALTTQVLQSGRRGILLSLPPPSQDAPTRLFDFRAPGHQQRWVRFAHPDAFRSQLGCTARLEFSDTEEALPRFLAREDGASWSLEQEDGTLQALPTPRLEDQTLVFSLPPAPRAAALVVTALPTSVPPASLCGRVWVSSRRDDLVCQGAICEGSTVTQDTFHPFGLSPEPWRCCYLSCPDVLSLPGARVTVSYTLSYTIWEDVLPGWDQPAEYRPIMRRLPIPPPQPRDVRAQSVVWEYWNGSAWLPVPGTQDWMGCFDGGEEARSIQAAFCWPRDVQPCQVQGQQGWWLRWRITQADGSRALPRRLHAPQVQEMRISGYLPKTPVDVQVCSGLTPRVQTHPPATPLFPSLGPEADGWWLAFDHPPHGDTLSLFVCLAGRSAGSQLTAWEATPRGEVQLGLEDGTDGLCHSGLVRLTGIRGGHTLSLIHI